MFFEGLVSVLYCHFMEPNTCSTYKLDTDLHNPNIHDVLVPVITHSGSAVLALYHTFRLTSNNDAYALYFSYKICPHTYSYLLVVSYKISGIVLKPLQQWFPSHYLEFQSLVAILQAVSIQTEPSTSARQPTHCFNQIHTMFSTALKLHSPGIWHRAVWCRGTYLQDH